MSDREESTALQIGSVKSTSLLNMSSINGRKSCLKRVSNGASGTLVNLQKSRSSLQSFKKMISIESVGIEKIFCRIRAERKPVRG